MGTGDLWIETFAARTGFERVSESVLGSPAASPYLFVAAVLVIDVPILSTIAYLRGYLHPLLAFPVRWLFTPVGLFLAIWIAKRMRDRYIHAVEHAGRRAPDEAPAIGFEPKLRYGLLGVGYAIYFAWLSTHPWSFIAREGALIGSIKWMVLIPLVYVTLLVDTTSVFLHNSLHLPYRLRRDGVELDFSDVTNLGGMYPAGKAMKRAAQLYFGGLAIWSAWELQWLVTGHGESEYAQLVNLTVFAVLWVAGATILLGGIVSVHRHMRTQKERTLSDIKASIEQLGDDDDTYFYTDPTTQADKIEYIQQVHHLREVRETRTFPFRITIAWEMFGVVLFPVGIQLFGIAVDQFA